MRKSCVLEKAPPQVEAVADAAEVANARGFSIAPVAKQARGSHDRRGELYFIYLRTNLPHLVVSSLLAHLRAWFVGEGATLEQSGENEELEGKIFEGRKVL